MNPVRPSSLASLGSGIALACRRPRVWLALVGMSLLMAWAVAAPVQQSAEQNFSSMVGFPGDQSFDLNRSVPRWMFDDWSRLKGGFATAASSTLAPLLLLSSLLGVFLAGCWMHAALHARWSRSFGTFVAGGGQYFWPFLRLWLLALAGYALVTWVVWGTPGDWLMARFFPNGDVALASNERTAWWAQNIYIVVYVFGLLKVEILIDLARASLVSGQRKSALGGLMRALSFWIRRWYAAFFLVGSGLLLEALWVAIVIAAVQQFALPLWTLALLVPTGRIILRGGRLGGIALLYHQSTQSVDAVQPTMPSDAADSDAASLDEGSAWGNSA
jgi:hypothetical protein